MDSEESSISHEIKDGILHVTVDGSVTISGFVTYVHKHIEVWAHNPRVLWDFRRAISPVFTSETLSGWSDELGEIFQAKGRGHTAILFRGADDLLGNMLVNLSDTYSVPVEYKAFVDLHEARKWLKSF